MDVAIQFTLCSTNDSDHKEVDEKEFFIGKLCRINYLLIVLSIIFICCSFFVSIRQSLRTTLILLSVFVLIFEAIARPFSYFGVSSKGLTEYRFGKKVRLIQWPQIIQVGKQLEILSRGARSGVIVTLRGAPLYTKSTKLSSFRYFLACRPNVLYIYNYSDSMPIIEKYYGPADYNTERDLPA